MLVTTRGARLFCSIRGQGPECLVLSVMGTKPYERQTERLSEEFRLVYVALRGSGESEGRFESLDFDVLAEDLEAVCDALGMRRVAVIGHSILGVFAIEYARRCPHRVSHVVIAGTPPRGDMTWLFAEQMRFFEQDASEERKRLIPSNLAELPPDQALLAQTPMRFFDPHIDAAPLYAGAQADPAVLHHLLGPLTSEWDVRHGSESLSVPMLIAHGRYDYISPYHLWTPIVPQLPNTRFELFERSGHQPFFEEPEKFAAVLGSRIGEHRGSGA